MSKAKLGKALSETGRALIRLVRNGSVFLIIVAAIIAVAVLIPLAFMWSINTLFDLGIAYTWKTWLAALIFIVFWVGSGSSTSVGKS